MGVYQVVWMATAGDYQYCREREIKTSTVTHLSVTHAMCYRNADTGFDDSFDD